MTIDLNHLRLGESRPRLTAKLDGHPVRAHRLWCNRKTGHIEPFDERHGRVEELDHHAEWEFHRAGSPVLQRLLDSFEAEVDAHPEGRYFAYSEKKASNTGQWRFSVLGLAREKYRHPVRVDAGALLGIERRHE